VVNVNKLKGKIVERGTNVTELALKIGMDRTTLYRRFSSGGEDFTIKEADLIARELNLTCSDASEIFFSQFVALNAIN
jgi:putative cro-like protein